jgi:MATE family multidrug resistance protein
MTHETISHPFILHPHRTLLTLSLPVLFSLIAEPLTGLVDTAFIARLGAEPLAALGVGTAALSSIFWVFNFLGIGTQTEIAQAATPEHRQRAERMATLAMVMGFAIGLALIVVGMFLTPAFARLMGATGQVEADAVLYMRIRLLSAPPMLLLLAAFGALRGLQDMRTPLWIALFINGINILLDALLVSGAGPLPALGIAGVAWATVVAQWLGGVWGATAVTRRLGWAKQLRLHEAKSLLKIGGDLFLRTGLLLLFMLISTSVATRISADAGAAHQAIRQIWLFTGLGLDALAITAQSLVGYFMGIMWMAQAKRVAAIGCGWGLAMGLLLSLLMWWGEDAVVQLLVPATAVATFSTAWLLAVLIQPVNALAFVTDGIHWGTGDFRYLRNVMGLATTVGVLLLFLPLPNGPTLNWVWVATICWIMVRAGFGVLRVWPGVGKSPFVANTF